MTALKGCPNFGGPWRKGQFNADGALPTFDDCRVELFPGWFDETLPNYFPPPHDRLVINIDADLYSSTAAVFHHLSPYIRPGTIIYFDELWELDHEVRAFRKFMEATRHKFQTVAATEFFTKAAFECIE